MTTNNMKIPRLFDFSKIEKKAEVSNGFTGMDILSVEQFDRKN